MDSIVQTHRDFPQLLREIADPPPTLYYCGDIQLLNQPQIAIVGARKASRTGCNTAYQFAQQLAALGFVITSGLALGIDAAAHQGALAHNGKTIAVLGNGLNIQYPRQNEKLSDSIRTHGLLISEFLPDTLPLPHHFPRRNRLISGLSYGVLVVEAQCKSGSLVTARMAMEQGREVFAVPGSIHSPLSRGCHQLLRDGAKLVENINDILEEIPTHCRHITHSPEPADDDIHPLLQLIGFEPTAMDTIIQRSQLSAAETANIIVQLEVEGLVEPCLGGYQRTGGKKKI